MPSEAADILDRMANPHPRLIAEARTARRRARWWRPLSRHYWRGMLAGMAAATGDDPAAIDARLA